MDIRDHMEYYKCWLDEKLNTTRGLAGFLFRHFVYPEQLKAIQRIMDMDRQIKEIEQSRNDAI